MKQYIVKRYAQSPFSADDAFKDALILVDQETGEPFCGIEYGDDKHVKEGDILNEGSFTAKFSGKRAKHIVVGDTVQFSLTNGLSGAYEGRVESIKEVPDGDDYLENMLTLVDCKRSAVGEFFKVKELDSTVMDIQLRKVQAKPWITASIPCPCCGK